MSDIDEAVKRLESVIPRFERFEELQVAGDIRLMLDALSEAREVLAGADHTAAKYWRRMTEAERERDELADHLVKTGEDADRYMRERDEALAVIERAKDAIGDVNEWDGHGRADQLDNTRRILRAALDKEGNDDE